MTKKVQIFTSTGTFTPNKTENTKKETYIQATGGVESIVHDKCGTPECCQMCGSAKTIEKKKH